MRFTYIALVILGGMTGCALPLLPLPPSIAVDATGHRLETQLNESAQRIEQLLVDISRARGISTHPHPSRHSEVAVTAASNGERLMVQWQGDVREVLRKLAAVKGLRFSVLGRPIPMPVSIHSINTDFVQILENIGVQLGNRADVVLKADALEIRYRGI
jgi:hypothetical protein